ncbi:hypothetical protein ACQ4PT_012024 [Festuca glaucescens]
MGSCSHGPTLSLFSSEKWFDRPRISEEGGSSSSDYCGGGARDEWTCRLLDELRRRRRKASICPSHPSLSTLAASPPLIVSLPRSADDAGHLFDGMPPGKKHESAPPARGADLISSLPDHLLHHVISFLPAQAAVQTCLLARRWRHLWRYTTGLRITGLDGPVPAEEVRVFVDHLLILRERTDLDTVEIKLGSFSEEDQPYLKLWARFAVMCKVRVLTFHIYDPYLYLDEIPLVSRHLRTLDLQGLGLGEAFLDFASCPALEHLKMAVCDISVDMIASRTLKHLSITNCHADSGQQVHLSTPGLVSLKLDGSSGMTPTLENMASLETAFVYLGHRCEDDCLSYDSGVFCGTNNISCENCVPNGDGRTILLGCISSAKHLELMSESGKFIFIRDLEHCPTFSKLKTLVLNEYWCEAPDMGPLACILKNSPVLEKLTLQLFSKGPNHMVEMKGIYSSVERLPQTSKHLNIVEVKCDVVDGRILKVLKFLCAYNIRFSFE